MMAYMETLMDDSAHRWNSWSHHDPHSTYRYFDFAAFGISTGMAL
jgi:hypothetical protein